MQRLAIGVGLVMSVAVACSGRSKSTDRTASTGGEGSLPDGGEATAPSGGATTADGGAAGGGNAGVSGGRAANTGGRSTGTGGNTSPSEGGAPVNTGGVVATGGGTVEPATGGSGSGDGGSGDGGGGGDAGAPPGNECGCGPLEQCFDGSLCVARSVVVPLDFAIDATEVTRSQYAAWLAVRPGAPVQSPQCQWNEDFEPDPVCMAQPSVCQGSDCGNHPQPCLDFCDAAAYCRAVGKQLCGGVGGGPTDREGADSEWLLACTANGKNDGISGGAFVIGQCNDQTTNSETTVIVGSKQNCQSSEPGYSGIFDLIGNLREWEDNCNTTNGATDVCHVRGGSFGVSAAAPLCSETLYADRGSFKDSIGFRCCEPDPGRRP